MSKSLTVALQHTFPSDVRQRGVGYYNRNAVQIEHADTTSVLASVAGSRQYAVSIQWPGSYVDVQCDCPYFEDHGYCKHVWATAMAYEARGIVPERLDGKATFDPNDPGSSEELESWMEQLHDGKTTPGSATRPPVAPESRWKRQLSALTGSSHMPPHLYLPAKASSVPQLHYFIEPGNMKAQRNGLVISVYDRKQRKNGAWSELRPHSLERERITTLIDPADIQIAAILLGASSSSGYYSYYSGTHKYEVERATLSLLLPMLCATGRCHVGGDAISEPQESLRMDGLEPWEFRLEISLDEKGTNYILAGALHRQGHRVSLDVPILLVQGGWIVWEDCISRLVDHDAFSWIMLLLQEKDIRVPSQQVDELMRSLVGAGTLPPLDLPTEQQYRQVRTTPQPGLRIRKPDRHFDSDLLVADVHFTYDGVRIEGASYGCGVYRPESHQLLLRDLPAEEAALQKLLSLGLQEDRYGDGAHLRLAPSRLPRIVATLVTEGWNVTADGSVYRRAGNFEVAVSSGIDWFDLHGAADFGGVKASLPQLLASLRKGESIVRLDDGSLGILPEEWLKKFGLLAQVGSVQGDGLRFKPTQAGFLDALLAAQPEATCDATFTRVREELRRFERIEPLSSPPGFTGELRPYQRDGLGWLHFLQRFGFGGCLADDMGLGKTVQVLALLESRRQLRAGPSTNGDRPRPSLVVVPRSLIFNWRQEAARFTPSLRVLDHTGTGRTRGRPDHFEEYDLILTTYGTMRRDAAHLKDWLFDYVIFDESQAIKNASSASAKAARLLSARHRLCLSGTPIENHLGELWSQFEVLNPGMLGASPALAVGVGGKGGPDEPTRQFLARVLRPFILRRTKSQVAKDLPEKTEQTLYCELDAAQRKQYDDLRDHYRQSLLTRITKEGMNKSKIQILEALLRLRQAAIHPGLIDKALTGESSAKLEALLPLLKDVQEGGHKALVFSQFTSMLSIVRSRLDDEQVVYEYLDGQTKDRQARVERFQTDPECGLFLISLKAGGLGLNLTAAEYVFLLDPWWNPAVEAQAIDRAHRIGQENRVFAYRLIAKDTVEDRILELQQSKRSLAEAIINADNSLIRNLSRQDLELLLG
jgi:superfamily II DNA or RNA helicase